MRKELIERIDRFLNPQSGNITEEIMNAYLAFNPPEDGVGRVIYIGQKRIGRFLSGVSLDSHGAHLHHYVYYFDYPHPLNPNLRIGIEGNGHKVRLYFQETSRENKITYISRLNGQEGAYYLQAMPRGNGNLVGEKELYFHSPKAG